VYYVRRQEDVKIEAAGSAFLSFLDAVTGFNQVVNTQRAREMLAVLSRSGCWLPRCLTFGPHNGPEDFSYVVDRLFSGGGNSRRRFCSTWLAYVDDLTVRSGRYAGGRLYTDEEYAELVRTAVIVPQSGRQSLSEVLKEAGFDLVEDKLGVELPDGRKKKPLKEGRAKPLDVPNFDNAKRDTNAPYAHAVRVSEDGPSEEIFCVACQTLKKEVFFETWPYISKWIQDSNRDKTRSRLVEQMYRRQGTYVSQVAFYRLRLAAERRRQGQSQEDPQNPADPYWGWDDFFWLDTLDSPRTIAEEWAWIQMWSINNAREDEERWDVRSPARQGRFRWNQYYAPHEVQNQEDQEVAEGNRRYAEAERIRLQPNNDYELRMSDNELAELRQRRLDYVDDSDVEGSSSSADGTTLLWGRTPTSQDEADLEAHEARDASDADWLEQNMRWHDTAQQD
jgi:hypothetical protein